MCTMFDISLNLKLIPSSSRMQLERQILTCQACFCHLGVVWLYWCAFLWSFSSTSTLCFDLHPLLWQQLDLSLWFLPNPFAVYIYWEWVLLLLLFDLAPYTWHGLSTDLVLCWHISHDFMCWLAFTVRLVSVIKWW